MLLVLLLLLILTGFFATFSFSWDFSDLYLSLILVIISSFMNISDTLIVFASQADWTLLWKFFLPLFLNWITFYKPSMEVLSAWLSSTVLYWLLWTEKSRWVKLNLILSLLVSIKSPLLLFTDRLDEITLEAGKSYFITLWFTFNCS